MSRWRTLVAIETRVRCIGAQVKDCDNRATHKPELCCVTFSAVPQAAKHIVRDKAASFAEGNVAFTSFRLIGEGKLVSSPSEH